LGIFSRVQTKKTKAKKQIQTKSNEKKCTPVGLAPSTARLTAQLPQKVNKRLPDPAVFVSKIGATY
jgi:hypothetical protein